MLPEASFDVTVTVFAPRSEHVNVVVLYSTDALVQLSRAVAVPNGRATDPFAPRSSEILLTEITGAI